MVAIASEHYTVCALHTRPQLLLCSDISLVRKLHAAIMLTISMSLNQGVCRQSQQTQDSIILARYVGLQLLPSGDNSL